MKAKLEQAHSLIREAANWTKHSTARNEKGGRVFVDESTACSFCSCGALLRVGLYEEDYGAAMKALAEGLPTSWMAGWADHLRVIRYNDSHTHEEVMKVWEKALENVQ